MPLARPERMPFSTAQAMGLTNHCEIMVVAAVEILEELLAEQKA